jgi:tRNA pseudouridine(55) synthase
MIIPIYQPVGSSSHLLAKQVSALCGQPATHTGTLDPMAEGVLLCLTGLDRFDKLKWNHYPKTYVFTVVVGISTDSQDLLGLVKQELDHGSWKLLSTPQIMQKVKQTLDSMIGEQNQQMPKFSSGRIAGESYFDAAKSDPNFQPKQERIKIHQLRSIGQSAISQKKLLDHVEAKISLVEGDFRQAEVVSSWREADLHNTEKNREVLLLHFQAQVSRRTYIRAIVRDLSTRIGIPLTTFHIIRTNNCSFSISDCVCLV